MKYIVYEDFPEVAILIRQVVFVEEQGFHDEFDETDKIAKHLVAWDDEQAVGTCRVFPDQVVGEYVLGRLAVLKDYRSRNVGAGLVEEACKLVKSLGGRQLILHSQMQAIGFYEKQGFQTYGEVGDDQGCPHMWMRKEL